MDERHDRLDAMLREGRLIRGAWTKGHDRACLLAALSPEAGAAESASACPAEVMPAWLAYLTPWLDDEPSAQAWSGIVARYAALARRWHVLDAEGWERARIAALIVIVAEARAHVAPEYAGVLAAIDGVIDWLRRGAPRDAADAVTRAAADAARATEDAAAAAVWAADAAEAAAAEACAAMQAAMQAADAAAFAAGWAASAAEASARAAWAAAADRIAAGVLDAIEHEIERMGGER